jgi:hypothetical protein
MLKETLTFVSAIPTYPGDWLFPTVLHRYRLSSSAAHNSSHSLSSLFSCSCVIHCQWGKTIMDSGFKVFKHPGRDRAWFVADCTGGTILVDNCKSLDAAIHARQALILRLQSELRHTTNRAESDTGW